MNPINWTASLVVVLAFVFCLQGAEQKETNFHHKGTGLYEMNAAVTKKINEQIQLELHASISYLAMAAHFGRDDVSMKGFRKFFMDSSNEEKEHADKLVDYLNSRNGHLASLTVQMPIVYNGDKSGKHALKHALELEKNVTKHLMELHSLASKLPDVHLVDTLESGLLREQVESIRKLTGLIARIENMGTESVAEFFIDQELHGKE
jgi:ferritin heavy chain